LIATAAWISRMRRNLRGTQQSKDKVETSRPFHGMDEWTKPSLVKSQDDCDTYNFICHCLHHYHVIYIYIYIVFNLEPRQGGQIG